MVEPSGDGNPGVVDENVWRSALVLHSCDEIVTTGMARQIGSDHRLYARLELDMLIAKSVKQRRVPVGARREVPADPDPPVAPVSKTSLSLIWVIGSPLQSSSRRGSIASPASMTNGGLYGMTDRQQAQFEASRPAPVTNASGNPRLVWLAAGALAGLLFAAAGLLESGPPEEGLPDGAIARINDVLITGPQFERTAAQLEASYGRKLTADDSVRLLQQLIEEELLLQRGIDLGLAKTDTTVRTAIVQSLIASVTAEADAADPGDEALQSFLEEHAERYTFAAAMSLDAWTAENEGDARFFLNQLSHDSDASPDEKLNAVPGLPESPAPLERLRMFVGPAIAAAAADMPVGSSAVFARQGRWYVVRVNSREESAIADLSSIRSQVLLDYRRSLADEYLADYLNELRGRANVQVALPQ